MCFNSKVDIYCLRKKCHNLFKNLKETLPLENVKCTDLYGWHHISTASVDTAEGKEYVDRCNSHILNYQHKHC